VKPQTSQVGDGHSNCSPLGHATSASLIVFLAGERAYKLKRAVLFDYLDF
jgi:aminoglycoside phosphotransferase family enzyme